MGSVCQPITLVEKAGPYFVATDGVNVYWTDNGGGYVGRVPVGGGAPVKLATNLQNPNPISLSGSDVYCGTNNGIYSVPKAGGTLTTVVPAVNASGGMDTDGTIVAWSDNGGATVSQVRIAGGPIVVLATSQGFPQNLSVNATSVFWSNYKTGEVMMVPKGGGSSPTVIASGQGTPFGILATASYVYWADEGSGTVSAAPLTSVGPPVLLVSGQNSPTGIALDATSIYFANVNGGSVVSAPLNGSGVATVLATGGSHPIGVAVDATAVYWADNGAGTVMKVALP